MYYHDESAGGVGERGRTRLSSSDAVDLYWHDYWLAMSKSHKVLATEDENTLRVITGIPFWNSNGVMCTRLTDATDLDWLADTVVSALQAYGLPYGWIVPSSSRSAALLDLLNSRGFTHMEDGIGMQIALDSLPTASSELSALSIVEVSNATELEQWGHAMGEGFGLPTPAVDAELAILLEVGVGPDSPLRHFLGLLDGEPVATSSLFVGADVAGLYYVSTVPKVRRRGIGKAMTLAPLREARARGNREAVLLATEMGHSIYRQLGFRDCSTYHFLSAP